MDINNIKSGAVRDRHDKRDYIYEKTLGAGEVITTNEWEEGYDIEKIIGISLNPNNQHSSSSCVGQAYSKYSAVLNFIETTKWDEHSAKAVYSQITLGYGKGAFLRDGAAHLVDWGSVFETIVKSYKDNGTTDEEFMINKTWITPEIEKLAKILQAKEYRLIQGIGIDIFARAIKDGNGVVAGVEGVNNGTWNNIYPSPPTLETPQKDLWGHALYFGKFRIKDGKKQVGFINSWGNIGENGWQWLGEEWFDNSNRFIFNPWVLIDKKNKEENMTFKKEKNSTNIYLVNEEHKTKSMVVDMESLDAFFGEYEEVDSLAEYKLHGTFAWFNRIIN